MEEYGQIKKIVDDTIKQAVETKQFIFQPFLQNMEKEFAHLGFREPSAGNVQKILILRLDAVGDFILLTPSIRAIRENFPRAYITLVVTKAVYPMAELCPYVNEVIAFDTPYKSSIFNNDLIQILQTAVNFSESHLWRRHFDLCFTFLADMTQFVMSYISGAKNRVGIGNDMWQNKNTVRLGKIFLNNPIHVDHSKVVHWCEVNLYILQAYGLKIKSTDLELWYSVEDLIIAKNILNDFAPNRIKVAVGVGANYVARKYPVDKYVVAFREIISKGAAIIILGGSSELAEAKFLEDNLPKEFVKNVVKVKSGWRVDTAVMSLCDIYVGNMTGACDVAAALKKPIVTLTRDSKDHTAMMGAYCEHIRFAPYGTKSVVLMPEHPIGDCAKNIPASCISNKPHCIAQIEPSEIVAAYEKILGRE